MAASEDRDVRVQELERQLRETSRRLEETQSLARVGSWEWELPARQARWSRELLRTFGRDPEGPPPTREELIAAIHPDDRPAFVQLIARIESQPGPFHHVYRIIDADGEIHHMQARGFVEADESGRPVRTHGTTQDITELTESQVQLEQARRLEAVGQLAGGVAHDFNNLLSVILNYAEYMISAGGDPETMEGLREIERAALTAGDLTRQLLLFSRRDSTELRPVDLAAVVAETEQLLRRTIGDHIELTVDAPAGLPPVTLAEGQAQQILVNLVVNSRDAMQQGGTIAVTIGEAGAGEEGDAGIPGEASHLVLAVADDGMGMPEEVVTQAFDPFFTTKPRGQGTGLGLATVYGIVGRVGGRVEIESEPGRGTTVSVYLPVSAEVKGAGEPLRGDPAHPKAGARSVLVVDNEEAVRTIVGRTLARHGYRVEAAGSGSEAEAILARPNDRVDLLLTDVLMPRMSGPELAERLRARHPALRVIYMSGYPGDEASPFGPWGDGATVLQKPFTGPQLLSAVGEALALG